MGTFVKCAMMKSYGEHTIANVKQFKDLSYHHGAPLPSTIGGVTESQNLAPTERIPERRGDYMRHWRDSSDVYVEHPGSKFMHRSRKDIAMTLPKHLHTTAHDTPSRHHVVPPSNYVRYSNAEQKQTHRNMHVFRSRAEPEGITINHDTKVPFYAQLAKYDTAGGDSDKLDRFNYVVGVTDPAKEHFLRRDAIVEGATNFEEQAKKGKENFQKSLNG